MGKNRCGRYKKDTLHFNPTQEIQSEHFAPATEPISARTEAQGHYILTIGTKRLTFGVGPAGTGKTFVAAALAAEALFEHRTGKIIVTRPAVESGESLGFLPGELDEKFDPFLRPVRDILVERMGKGHVDYMIRHNIIEAAPLAYMRGRTFKNAWVILDEAQNTTPAQMKLFLTRIGDGCKVIVNGDLEQSDVPGKNGLEDALERLFRVHSVGICRFGTEDVVRSGLVREILAAYAGQSHLNACPAI